MNALPEGYTVTAKADLIWLIRPDGTPVTSTGYGELNEANVARVLGLFLNCAAWDMENA